MIDEGWPHADLEAVRSCPICTSGERRSLYKELTDQTFGVAPGRWDLYECLACKSGYLDPRPTANSIARAYSDYYTHEVENHRIVRRKGRLRTLLHDLINGYQNRFYGLNRTPALPIGQWLLPFIPSLRAAADAECRHLPQLPHSGGRLLDVGCGNGGFLELGRQVGWEVEGVDFDEDAVKVAQTRGLNVSHGGVDLLDGRQDCFDVITMCHVIEHVHEPKELLRKLHRLLKPGGMLWIETPNIQGLGAKKFGPSWRGLEPPRHLVLFGWESLRKCLMAAGFESVRQEWRGMSVFDVFASSEALMRGEPDFKASYDGRPSFRTIAYEFLEMFRPRVREFLTFTARRK